MEEDPLSSNQSPSLTVVHYAADIWQHVCPTLRLSSPLSRLGWNVLHGNEWDEDCQILVDVEKVRQADVVVIQRDFPRHLQPYQEIMALARQLGKPVVYELDDLLFELPEIHPDVEHYMSVRASVLAAVADADLVTCTTPALRQELLQYAGQVFTLPNYLDENLWNGLPEPQAAGEGERVVIGYLGAHSHAPDLALIAPLLQRLLARYGQGLLLRVWGMTPQLGWEGGANVEWLDIGLVDYSQFAAFFLQQQVDLCIAPLQNHLFNQCKSPLKYLEYAALGCPGVFSAVGGYAGIVKHGETGFLAQNEQDWETCLVRLVEDGALRRRMGQAARRDLREHWLLDGHAGEWEAVYRQAAVSGEQAKARRLAATFYAWNRQDQERLRSARQEVARLSSDLQRQAQALEDSQAKLDLMTHKRDALRQELSGAQEQVSHAHQQLAFTQQQLAAITSSPGWKALERLYRARLVVIPRGTLRERLFHQGIAAALHLKRHGLRSFMRRAAGRLRGDPPLGGATNAPAGAAPGPAAMLVAQDGQMGPQPLLSLVLAAGSPTESVVRAWLAQQTVGSVELVRWDAEAGTAASLEEGGRTWHAASAPELCRQLAGRYVCLASAELMNWHSTFLEANLLALETEGLLFTLNSSDRTPWYAAGLAQNCLPGGVQAPLARLVVRKELVAEQFALDLEGWAERRSNLPAVIGKVIAHTLHTPAELFPAAPALETPLRGAQLKQQGWMILGRAPSQELWDEAPHIIHPVNTVMPAARLVSSQPVVFVLMPFLAVGGAERVALDMMRGLQDEVTFVVIAVDDYDSALGTTVDAFRKITPYVYVASDFLNHSLSYSFITYLIERYNPRTYYIANGSPFLYDSLSSLKAAYPNLRLVNQVYDHAAGWINRYDSSLAAAFDANIGCNQRIGQAYIEHQVPPERSNVIENGVDETEYDAARYTSEQVSELKQRFGLPAGKRVITFVSRLHAQKRPLDFIELCRRCSSDPSLVFLMVGDGPLEAAVEAQVQRIGLKNLVRLPFYRPSRDIFAVSDVIVLPSEYEGMPMVILEAQAMGRPVLATDVGNNRQVLDATGGGLVVSRVGDVAGLQAGLQQLLARMPAADEIRQAVLRQYSLQAMVARYRQALLEGPDV